MRQITTSLLAIIFLVAGISCAAKAKSCQELIMDLESNNPNRRHDAAVSLWRHGEKAIPALSKALFDPDKDVQSAAITSLASIGTDAAKKELNRIVPELKNDLENADPNVRQKAFELLSTIGTPEAMDALSP